ncbi:ubiquitin recognition factor in ER-associated degradation protein 1 isoform X2 [Neocloeon triangulifer]|nr:ubiquitin recognition factor in ER-associated degradation protein 1 isoform X2 [Neocloeon triangulifer]
MLHDMMPSRPFKTGYRAYSVSMLPGNERSDVEKGGKIIMPPSALEQLTRQRVVYPMLFKLKSDSTKRETHCGVLEFVADEGKVYLPNWMMRNMLLEEASLITVESVSLPVATFSKFQPQSEDFLDISNPKAVLENALRHFACLTTGDMISIIYNSKVYELCVLETKPGPAVSIIECDMNVDFAAPVGYKEPEIEPKKEDGVCVDSFEMDHESGGFQAFGGAGQRLDGKKKKEESVNGDAPNAQTASQQKGTYTRGIPDYDYQPGVIRFMRHAKPQQEKEEVAEDFKYFSGAGRSLRDAKSRK